MSGRGAARREVPPPGAAPLPAGNAAALLLRNGTDHEIALRPAVRFFDQVWTHGAYLEECRRWARLLQSLRPESGPFHVGVLLDNTPEYLFVLGAAALVGATVVGLNSTRRDEHLLRDVAHTDVGLLVTEPRHQDLLAPILDRLPVPADHLLVSSRFAEAGDPAPALGRPLAEALEEAAARGEVEPGGETELPAVDTTWALLFTSGTSDAPKAVVCTQRRILVTGNRMGMILDLGPDDVGYVCMPLFHSNALMVGWAPSIVYGASVALARRFSASRWLDDVRGHGATWFNYTGKPLAYILATPERPDDSDNPLRVAFGNEGSPQVVEAFSRRFGVEVIDAFGATEGGVAVNREEGMPEGAMGRVGESVKVVDEQGGEQPRARLDGSGRPQPVSGRSRGTTTTPRPTPGPRDSAGTGAATWATSTVRASSTSRAGRPTGYASTARTSRPGRWRRPWGATPTWSWPPPTACPTPRPGIRSWCAWSGARVPPSIPSPSPAGSTASPTSGPSGGPVT
ncbi:MAG: hypothetical protein E6G27_14065 [Actinobacteria bacterium]|nr:MAG: hypothetical protein E6G27_14065 [Actinomycetota bacterium]